MAPSHMIHSHVPLYVTTYLVPPMTCSYGTYNWPTHMATITYDPFSWHPLLTCTIMYDCSRGTITQHSNAQNFRACCISLAIPDGVCHSPAHTRGPAGSLFLQVGPMVAPASCGEVPSVLQRGHETKSLEWGPAAPCQFHEEQASLQPLPSGMSSAPAEAA